MTQDYATELKMFELINFKKIFFIVYISITSQNKIQKEALQNKYAQQTKVDQKSKYTVVHYHKLASLPTIKV